MVDLPSAEAILPPSLPDFVPILVPEVDIPVLPLAAIENMTLPELPLGSFASVSAPGTPGVLPLLLNPAECEAALRERFPATLEGLELNVESILQVYVDEMGRVGGVQLRISSGYPELDLIAQQVVREVARFRSATDAAGRPTPVWVGIPMGFENVFVAGTPSSFRVRGHSLTQG
jgi:TonB family protein